MMSSLMPSEKYSCSASPLMLLNASTAMEGLSGTGGGAEVFRAGSAGIAASAGGGADLKRIDPDRLGDVLELGLRRDR